MQITLKTTLFFVLSCASLLASVCDYPDYSDPDEFFDSIGRSDFCQYLDRDATPDQRSYSTREDFGGGMASSSGGSSTEGGRAVAIAQGGISFVAGRALGATNDFQVIKYFADGSLDTAFNTDGIATYSFGSNDDWAHAVAVQTNGLVVVAGRSDSGGVTGYFDFGVLRIDQTGNLDTSFSTDGLNLVGPGPYADIARSIHIQTDAKILLGGYSKSGNWGFGFARLKTDGELDTAFSSDGMTTVANGSNDNGAFGIVQDLSGKVVAGGTSYNGANFDFAAVRLLATGALDTSFATDGSGSYAINAGADVAYSVKTDLLDRVILVGSTHNATNLDFGIARLHTGGSFDTSFDTDGRATLTVLAGDDVAFGAELETSGNVILAAGFAHNGSNNDFAVTRVLSSGNLDTSFNTTGRLSKAIKAAEDTAQAIAVKSNGVIMVAGRTDSGGSNYDFAIMRLQSDGSMAASGQPVRSFGTNGFVAVDFSGNDYGINILTDSLGRLVISGYSSANTNAFAIGRLLINGNLDTSFHTDGKNETDLGGTDQSFGSTIQTDGMIVLAGSGGASVVMQVARYRTDGLLDTSFYTLGSRAFGTVAFRGVAQTTTGKLVLAGSTAADAYVVRLESNGVFDTTFKTTGFVMTNMIGVEDILNVLIQSDGKTVIYGDGSGVNANGLMARYLTNGDLDTTFNTDGFYNYQLNNSANLGTAGNSLSIAPWGAYYQASSDSKGADELRVYRVNTSGFIDSSFATTGQTPIVSGSVSVSATLAPPNGKVLIALNTASAYSLYRYTTAGTIDTTFGTNGFPSFNVTGGNDLTHGATLTNEGWICINGESNGSTNFGILCAWQ